MTQLAENVVYDQMVRTGVRAGEPRRARPVLWWAGLGAASLALGIYMWSRWLLSGPERTPIGSSKVPTFMLVNARAQEIVGCIAFVYLFNRFVVRPWRRDGHMSWDGSFFLAACIIYWGDLAANYINYNTLYNSAFVNWGSWFNYLPGWAPPNGAQMVEAPLWSGTWYSFGIFGVAVLYCNIMRRIKARWPRIGTLGTIGIFVLMSMAIDLLIEVPYVILGTYTYPGALKGWTLFYGHYYQFPLYEPVVMGAFWSGCASIRYFRNDKGQSFVESGLERVTVGSKGKAWLRTLSLTAALTIVLHGLYTVPFTLIQGLHSGAWPEDIVSRSYFTNGLCGPGTHYACPGPEVPNVRRGGVAVDPDGNLYVPPGTKLPGR